MEQDDDYPEIINAKTGLQGKSMPIKRQMNDMIVSSHDLK